MEEGKKIIACVGPESSGKTTLTNQLAEHFGGTVVLEFARDYLSKLGRPYEQDDLLTIAEYQLKLERSIIDKSNGYIFCDTDVLTVLIWHQLKYRKRNREIEKLLDQQSDRKYLLTNTELPWEPDPLRESPDDLKTIFRTYKYSLKMISPDFEIIEGTGEQRLQNAIEAVNQFDFG